MWGKWWQCTVNGLPIATDTVGEFPAGSVWQEPGQAESRWNGKSAAADALNEFANSIMCGGDPSFEFYRGNQLVLTLGCQHGRAIRWPDVWPGDGALTEDSADALCEWLSKHGAPRSLEQRNQKKRQRLAAQRRSQRYAQVIPQTMLDRLRKAQSQNEAVAVFQAGPEDRIERVRHYPACPRRTPRRDRHAVLATGPGRLYRCAETDRNRSR
jgi:hypothetical protein